MLFRNLPFSFRSVTSKAFRCRLNRPSHRISMSTLQEIDEIILKITKMQLEDRESAQLERDNARLERENARLERQSVKEGFEFTQRLLYQLIGYNQNQDHNLEISANYAFKRYLTHNLRIPKEFIFEYATQKIIDPSTGNIAVEWDAIFLIKCADNFEDITHPSVKNNTVYLLEVKQNIWVDQELQRVQSRVQSTCDALASSPRTKKIGKLMGSQKDFFDASVKYAFVVALGGRNVNATVAESISSFGLLALMPNGDEFTVKQPLPGKLKFWPQQTDRKK